jgi:protein-L-isoaspartate(D-aspartate) O-methyltransferase
MLAALITLRLAACVTAQQTPDFQRAREQMVRDEILGAGISNPRVIAAMRATPRHEFVPLAEHKNAYFDMSLPIGAQQTISSPFIVAYMTECLDPQPTDKVLEIGTGSGYQAAVLSSLVAKVYTVEIVPALGRRAEQTLKRLGYDNVEVKIGDGYQGWPDRAPFDKIIVTCSPEEVPQPLMDQLAEGGQLLIPVGTRYDQMLYLFAKRQGKLVQTALRPTLFVPMTGEAESRRTAHADAANPRLANGSFEEEPTGDDVLKGWYYQRQLQRVADADAPHGLHYARFENETAGRPSRALQGFAIDGRQVRQLRISAWIKLHNVQPGATPDMLPKIAVTFYDGQRSPIHQQWLGPWQGTMGWQGVSHRWGVPGRAREAILRLDMFGGTGQFCVDDVRLEVAKGRQETAAPTDRGSSKR